MTDTNDDPWMNLHKAAEYAGFTTSGLRSCVDRRELIPDGRGAKKIAMFRRSTIDRFLESRLRSHEKKAKEPSAVIVEPPRVASTPAPKTKRSKGDDKWGLRAILREHEAKRKQKSQDWDR